MKITSRDSLQLGGFAGLTEHQLAMDRKVFGLHARPGSQAGLGNFIYLADANFQPYGETGMHPHREVDVISVMMEGRIKHEGSMGHGEDLDSQTVQIQRAGGEGFSHNEVNPDDTENRMLQLWVLPEIPGQPASYSTIKPKPGSVTRIYGGSSPEGKILKSRTQIDILQFAVGERLKIDGEFLLYQAEGKSSLGDKHLKEGDLVSASNLTLQTIETGRVILITLAEN